MTPVPKKDESVQFDELMAKVMPQQTKSPFVAEPITITTVAMPADSITIAGKRYYTISQVSRHLKIHTATLHNRCNDGTVEYIRQPLLKNGKKLISEETLRKLLGA